MYTLEEILFIQVRLRSSTDNAGPVAYFQDDGSTLTYGSDSTGTGTDPLCSEEDHGQATGTFSSNGGTILAYLKDSSAPESMILHFTFGYKGQHLILGGCEPNRASEDYALTGLQKFRFSLFGCDADDPIGMPVSSSASGRVFDFACANTEYTFGVGGPLSAVVNTGTLALNP